MQTPLVLDEVGEQLLAELLYAPKHASPRINTSEDGNVSVGTHVGLRRPRNEDRAAIARIDLPSGLSFALSFVCDGVGSSKRGDEAAAIAGAAMISLLSRERGYRAPGAILQEIVRQTDEIIRNQLAGSGLTTICALLATSKGTYALTSIGDTRAYSWEPDSDLIQLTEDDTLENEIRRLNLPSKSLLNERGLEGSLSQALGEMTRASDDLMVRIVSQENMPPGGVLIASDGAWVNAEGAFQSIARHCSMPNDLSRRLLTAAAWLGGVDNASAVAIRSPQQLPSVLPEQVKTVRVSVWLPETKFVLYPQPAGHVPLVAASPTDPKKPTKRSSKKKGKDESAAQLELPATAKKEKPNNILAGPDEN